MKPLESILSKEVENPSRTFKWEAKWILRYQIHLKCRGVLSNKGYLAAIGGVY
jgi:hypothetical protein